MERVFIISELGSNWRFGNELENACRMIRAAKECGADAAKFQWVSHPYEMSKRRGLDVEAGRGYQQYVMFPQAWLPLLKAECDRVGIEFMVTAYLPQDVAVIAPYVKRFKVAAKESYRDDIRDELVKYDKPIIVSCADSENGGVTAYFRVENAKHLWCVSKYPTPIDEARLHRPSHWEFIHGLSDHTAHVLTGAVAVGAGARIIESHVRLHDTPEECPDYGHSLTVDGDQPQYPLYVRFIRDAERMM